MSSFIIDTQLPPKLAKYLKDKGFNSIHTTDFPNGHLLKDSEILEIAVRESRVVVTKDQDFFDHYLIKGSPPKVIYLQLGNIGNGLLIDLFEANFEILIKLLHDGAEMILFSREKIAEYSRKS